MSAAVPTPHEGPTTGEPAPSGFRQRLGLFDATMLVAGTMIGSGIFVVSADISREVGASGWLMAVWVLTGVMTIMGALSYAELAAMMPHAGGQYVYLREAFSPLWGFLYGWAVIVVIQTGSAAAVAVAFAKFLGVLVPKLGTDNILLSEPFHVSLSLPGMGTFFERTEFTISAGQLVAVGVVIFLTLLNCRGVQEGKWVQNLFTVAKTLALTLLIILGLTVAFNPQAVEANLSNVWGGVMDRTDILPLVGLGIMGASMVGSLFSADAWNNVTFTAGEVKNPRRNLPLSLLFGTGLVITLYLLANLAYMAVLPVRPRPDLEAEVKRLDKQIAELNKAQKPKEADAVRDQKNALLDSSSTFDRGIARVKDDRVGTAVLERASPSLGVPFIAIAVMISTFGCVNGILLMGARLYYAMAQDGLFFQSVGRLNSRGVPAAGLILQGLWSVALIFSGTYNDLLDYVMFAALLFYVLTVGGLFVLRWTQPNAERPYRALGYPLIPALYVLLCAAIMVDLLILKPQYTWPGLILVLAGIPVYFFWRLTNPRPRGS